MVILWRKQQHYFTVRLSQDLFGDWVVTRSWGNLNNNLGGCKHDTLDSYQRAVDHIQRIGERQLKRGYHRHTEQDSLVL